VPYFVKYKYIYLIITCPYVSILFRINKIKNDNRLRYRSDNRMFFAKPGEYEPCGILTSQHLVLIAVTLIGIAIALKSTINTQNVRKIIKRCTIFICVFEVIMITFKIATGGISNLNNYVPLYFCAMLIYAGLLSSFTEGKLKRAGEVFLATGSIIGGIVFIFFPTTSLPTYPMFHFVSIHSFIFHGMMIYLGLLVNLTNYIEIEKKDISYYFTFVGITCVIAYIVNKIFNSNLMFISENFPGTIIEIFYNIMGRFFTPFMMLGQATLPFYVIYGVRKLFRCGEINRDENQVEASTNL